jgi:hypothetical protein
VVRNFVQIGAAHRAPVPNETDNKYPSTCPTSAITACLRAQNSRAVPRHDEQVLGKYQGSAASNLLGSQTSAPPPLKDPSKNRSRSQSSVPGQRSSSTGASENRSTAGPTPSPSRAKEGSRAEGRKPPKEATTPRIDIFFKLPGPDSSKAQKSEMGVNPFASPADGNQGGDFRSRGQEDDLEGWSFQGRKKHTPKLATPKPDVRQGPARTLQLEPTSGGKRAQFHSEVNPGLLIL